MRHPTRTSVVQKGDHFYIALEMCYSGQWMTLNRISRPYKTNEEALEHYSKLKDLGYTDPSLYQAS